MKLIFTIFLCCICIPFTFSQYNCSSIPLNDPAFVNPSNDLSATGGLVKLYFHLYNDSNGNGGFPEADIPMIMNRLHTDFSQTNFTFFYNPCETEVVNSNFYHNSSNECDFWERPDLCDDGVHIHLKGDDAAFSLIANGSPGSQILIGGTGLNVQFATSSIITHEMGHVFGLLHTFHGYCLEEGEDCYGNPYTIPCDDAGDGVDDTPLDRNSLPTAVNDETCLWNGFSFCTCDETIDTSPTDNFMAYSKPLCMNNFTNGQKIRMYINVNKDFIHDAPSYNDPIPAYKIVDVDGKETSSFCKGDKIYLDACYSSKETKYRIGIFEYEIGGYANGEANIGYSRTDPAWINEKAPCGISLDDIWANFENYEFRPGHEYRVQLAVQNECSTGWFAKADGIFTIHHPTPDYIYVDAEGNPKDEFCVDEIVYMDASASYDENKFRIGIWKYNLGGFENGEATLAYSRTDPKWQYGELGNLINLNEIWANFQDPFFEPGFEYLVQLAVRGDCDPGGWNVKEDQIFTVVCCEEPEDCADFEVTTMEDANGNIHFSFSNKDLHSYTHQWTVYQHDNQGEGPFTVFAESNAAEFSFTAPLGGCYTIVHQVDTPCGSCCYSREVCNDGGKEGFQQLISGVDGCSIDCGDIVPSGLTCTLQENGLLLFDWDDVEGVDFYLFRFKAYDPDCCGGNIDAPTAGRVTEISEYEYESSGLANICFSWQVETYCEGSNDKQLSEKVCYTPEEGCGDDKDDDKDDDKAKSSFENQLESTAFVEVFPNPSDGRFQFIIHAAAQDQVEEISLINVDGQIVQKIPFENISSTSEISGTYEGQDQESGVYFIRVQFNHGVLMKKVMIIK